MVASKKYFVHKTAIIEMGAVIGDNCHIGPFCLVGANVNLGSSVKLLSHVVVTGNTSIGDDTKVWPFSSIGHQPQDLKYKGEKTKLVIGARNKIRESVSINPGTRGGGGLTKIGDDCLFMLGSHVGHDCLLGNSVIVANNTAIAGHVTIGNNVNIGGLSGVHQFCRIGEGSMIGALSMISSDVIPFTTVVGERPKLSGLNLIGLRRRGVSKKTLINLKAFYNKLFGGDENFKKQAEKFLVDGIENEYELSIINFILSDSKRSFLTTKN